MNVEKKVIEIIAELAVLEVEDVSLDSSLVVVSDLTNF